MMATGNYNVNLLLLVGIYFLFYTLFSSLFLLFGTFVHLHILMAVSAVSQAC